MITAKEKAEELVWKYLPILEGWKNEDSYLAIQCAIIAVNEMLDDDVYDMSEELFEKRINYLQEVKTELKKL